MKTGILTAILVSGILIFGSMSGALPVWAQDETPQQNIQNNIEEETLNKIAQDLVLLDWFIKLAYERDGVQALIGSLESLQIDDPVFRNKIYGDWLPGLREYLKMIENLLAVVDKFGKREDIITNEEFSSEMKKNYSQTVAERAKRIDEEIIYMIKNTE